MGRSGCQLGELSMQTFLMNQRNIAALLLFVLLSSAQVAVAASSLGFRQAVAEASQRDKNILGFH